MEHNQHKWLPSICLDNGSKRVAFIGGANHLDIVREESMVIWKPCVRIVFRSKKSWLFAGRSIMRKGKIATETLLSLPQPPGCDSCHEWHIGFCSNGSNQKPRPSHSWTIWHIIGYTDEQHANYVEPKLSAVSHQTYKWVKQPAKCWSIR